MSSSELSRGSITILIASPLMLSISEVDVDQDDALALAGGRERVPVGREGQVFHVALAQRQIRQFPPRRDLPDAHPPLARAGRQQPAVTRKRQRLADPHDGGNGG